MLQGIAADTNQFMLSIISLIGVIATFIVGLGTFLKYRAEAKKIGAPEAALNPSTAKLVTEITNALLEASRDEIRNVNEDIADRDNEIKRLKETIRVLEQSIALLRIEVAELKLQITP